jgi:tRNA (guanine-N7-)-methyltransferase
MQFGLLQAAHDIGRDFWLAGGAFERVEIELGPGDCGHLKAAARRAPSTLFVGIEMRSPVVERVRARGDLPANLRLLEGDARWMILHLLAPGSIDAFHAYFPDPWWKKRHHKRRLFQQDFCRALRVALAPGGSVLVRTDVAALFADIAAEMETAGFAMEPLEETASGEEAGAYERKYRRQGRRLFQGRFVRRPD